MQVAIARSVHAISSEIGAINIFNCMICKYIVLDLWNRSDVEIGTASQSVTFRDYTTEIVATKFVRSLQ